MIGRGLILLGVPVVLAAVVAGPLGLWHGDYQWLCAAIAVGLVVPPGLVTLILADRLSRMSVFGPLLALAIGMAIRIAVAFGGAVVVFLLGRATFEADPISYFGWLLGVYLTTLVTETALLARSATAIPGGRPEPSNP